VTTNEENFAHLYVSNHALNMDWSENNYTTTAV